MSKWPGISFYVTMALALALDQATKAWATAWLEPVRYFSLVPGFFSLSYGENTGIAFGMLAHEEWLVAAFVAALALVAIYYLRGMNWAGCCAAGRWATCSTGGGSVTWLISSTPTLTRGSCPGQCSTWRTASSASRWVGLY